MHGTYDPTPVVLDRWAALYNCTDARLEQTVPDPENQLDRESVIFSYPSAMHPC